VSVGKCDPAEQLDKGRGVLCYLIYTWAQNMGPASIDTLAVYGAVTLEIVR